MPRRYRFGDDLLDLVVVRLVFHTAAYPEADRFRSMPGALRPSAP